MYNRANMMALLEGWEEKMKKIVRALTRTCLLLGICLALILTSAFPQGVSTAIAQVNDEGTQYVVQRGDTLYSIARRFGTDVATLLTLNPEIPAANLIYVGMPIRLPTPVSPWSEPDVNIEVISPVAETQYHSPIEVIGYSRTFESQVDMQLIGADGIVLAERSASGGGADGYDFFHTYLRFNVTEPMTATLELFDQSGPEGKGHLVSLPLTLLPGQRFIDLDEPAVGEVICGTAAISGYSLTFEANVSLQVDNRNGVARQVDYAMGGGVDYREFSKQLPIPVDGATPLMIGAHEVSAADGELIDWTRIPVSVYHADSSACD